jgi:sugar transferase (PEP-CTERM/EpsH1 system associated)
VTAAAVRPVRVMHVIHHLQPGGMEYGLVKLVNGLAGSGIESVICSTTTASPAMKALLAADVRVVELSRRAGNDPTLIWQLFKTCRRERPDIVHTHAWGTLVEGYVAARLARVPAVMHGEHGTLQLAPSQVRVQRWVWSRVDWLLSVSSRLAERMSAAVGVERQRITVVRNGVDLTRFGLTARDAARRELGVDDDVVLVGHAGRLVEVKDQAALVQAAAALKAQGERFRVVIAGEGPLRGALEAQIDRLGVSDCVQLLGHRGDVERFFAALDVYVLCSRSEGMPNTILEAMATGVPVVSTQVGGADELVVEGQTGLLVPPVRPDLLAEGIGRLVGDVDLRTSMGAAGKARATQAFSLAAMVAGYRDVYLEGAKRQ